MTYQTWQEATRALEEVTGPITPLQKRISKLSGFEVSEDMPKLIADVILRVMLDREIGLYDPTPLTESQSLRIEELTRPSDFQYLPGNQIEASAYIDYLRLIRRKESIGKLRLNRGDVVQTVDGDVAEVSSIGKYGRVYFRGGQGIKEII